MRTTDYDLLEAAIRDGRRLSVRRRGTEYVVIPLALVTTGTREAITATNPTTGHDLTLYLDEIDSFEAIGR